LLTITTLSEGRSKVLHSLQRARLETWRLPPFTF
jgi:hypothetical protein